MNNITKDWNRWIMSSIYNHFKKGTTLKINFDNEDPLTNDSKQDSLEFKHLGPDYNYISKSEISVMVSFNVCVKTFMDIKEPYRHMDQIGIAQSLFPRCITVYKYGPNRDVDDKSMFTGLIIMSPIRTTPFGAMDPATRILRTTVEASYSAVLEGDD